MAPEMKPKPPLLAVSDADWTEAVQRESVLRPLFTQPRVGLPAASAAASALGLSVNQPSTGPRGNVRTQRIMALIMISVETHR